jgi:hypothetical protein
MKIIVARVWFCDAVCIGEVAVWQTYFTDQVVY